MSGNIEESHEADPEDVSTSQHSPEDYDLIASSNDEQETFVSKMKQMTMSKLKEFKNLTKKPFLKFSGNQQPDDKSSEKHSQNEESTSLFVNLFRKRRSSETEATSLKTGDIISSGSLLPESRPLSGSSAMSFPKKHLDIKTSEETESTSKKADLLHSDNPTSGSPKIVGDENLDISTGISARAGTAGSKMLERFSIWQQNIADKAERAAEYILDMARSTKDVGVQVDSLEDLSQSELKSFCNPERSEEFEDESSDDEFKTYDDLLSRDYPGVKLGDYAYHSSDSFSGTSSYQGLAERKRSKIEHDAKYQKFLAENVSDQGTPSESSVSDNESDSEDSD